MDATELLDVAFALQDSLCQEVEASLHRLRHCEGLVSRFLGLAELAQSEFDLLQVEPLLLVRVLQGKDCLLKVRVGVRLLDVVFADDLLYPVHAGLELRL